MNTIIFHCNILPASRHTLPSIENPGSPPHWRVRGKALVGCEVKPHSDMPHPISLANKLLLLLFWLMVPLLPLHAEEEAGWALSGYTRGELRWFPETAQYPGQKSFFPSIIIQPELYRTWDNGHQSLTIVPFLRLGPVDTEQTHFDLREFTWVKVGNNWEFRAGLRKVFWGVTESQHLVDIINQTDLVESFDGEEKLGQPMLNLSISRDWGVLDIFVLPWFRERTFPGVGERLRTYPQVDPDQAQYESSADAHHLDWAARWFHSLGGWDIGLSYFSGTGRDPLFHPNLESGHLVLAPFYPLIEQAGLDLQATMEAWLWKLEVISRQEMGQRHTAATGGFEYTFVGVLGSDADLGVIGEYLFDDRGDVAPTPFQNDIMAGMRLTLNDADSSTLLLGTIIDPDSGGMGWNLETSKRVWENWKLSLEGRAFVNLPAHDVLSVYRRDAYIQLELAHYF